MKIFLLAGKASSGKDLVGKYMKDKFDYKGESACILHITAPLYEAGIMEIYDYNELLQPFYRKQKRVISILGISKTRDEAKELVADILEDTFSQQGNADIKTYFGLGSI